MSLRTFNPPQHPSAGMQDKPEISLWETEFGDGYSQPTPKGINHIRRVLTLKWELLEPSEKDEIVNFLTMQKGNEPFFYSLPGDACTLKYSCREWDTQARGADLYDVNAVFRQNFSNAS